MAFLSFALFDPKIIAIILSFPLFAVRTMFDPAALWYPVFIPSTPSTFPKSAFVEVTFVFPLST